MDRLKNDMQREFRLTQHGSRYRAFHLILALAAVFACSVCEAADKHPAKPSPTEKAPAEISFSHRVAPNGSDELTVLSSEPIRNHQTILLENPTRLVLDIPDVVTRKKFSEIPVNGKRLHRIRIASHPDKVRFVFDLTEENGITHKILLLDKGLKMMIAAEDSPAAAPSDAAATAQKSPVVEENVPLQAPPVDPPPEAQTQAPEPLPVSEEIHAAVSSVLLQAPPVDPPPEAQTQASEPLPVPEEIHTAVNSVPAQPPPVAPVPERKRHTMSKNEIDTLFGSQLINVFFYKSPVKNFFSYVAEASGRQIEVGDEFTETLSLRLEDVPLGTMVNAAADIIGFALEKDGDRIVVVQRSETLQGKAPAPTRTSKKAPARTPAHPNRGEAP